METILRQARTKEGLNYAFAFSENRFEVCFSGTMESTIHSHPLEQGLNSSPNYVTETGISERNSRVFLGLGCLLILKQSADETD